MNHAKPSCYPEPWFVCKNCGKGQVGEPVWSITVGNVTVGLGPCCAPPGSGVIIGGSGALPEGLQLEGLEGKAPPAG